MGSKLRFSLWYSYFTITMYKIAFAVVLSVASDIPIEDTPEVAAAKEAFATVYKTVEAGDHINLRPVNNDVQAPQIANMYLDDTVDVAEAKEQFMAEFRNVEAGGLMAKQAPAPVHEVKQVAAAPVSPVAVYNNLPYHHMYYNNLPYNMVYSYNHVAPATHHINYAAVPHTYAYTYPYVMP